MVIRNLTPHTIHFYTEAQFSGLEKLNPTTFIADAVEGDPVLQVESEGMLRVATTTVDAGFAGDIPMVETEYGEIYGCPDDVSESDTLVVSLPALSMAKQSGHPLAKNMACPYKVVRQRGNTSVVLGAMGLSK